MNAEFEGIKPATNRTWDVCRALRFSVEPIIKLPEGIDLRQWVSF